MKIINNNYNNYLSKSKIFLILQTIKRKFLYIILRKISNFIVAFSYPPSLIGFFQYLNNIPFLKIQVIVLRFLLSLNFV